MAQLVAFHIALSLTGIVSGVVVVAGLIRNRLCRTWTGVFLASTVATSATGFLFPFHVLLPSHGIGAVSLVVLAVAIYALYAARLVGGWRRTYVATAVTALYLNVFVLVEQAFQKVPALKAAAPRQSEPPFLLAQVGTLALFTALCMAATRRFKVPVRGPASGGAGAPGAAGR